MRKWIRLSGLLLLYVLFSAKSCNEREEFLAAREKERLVQNFDSLTFLLGSDSLPAIVENAFESSVMQKLGDLVDYVNIVGDTAVAKGFREQSARMIQELFISPDVRIRMKIQGDKNIKGLRLPEFIKIIETRDWPYTSIVADSSWIIKPLKKINDSLYSGQFGFSFSAGLKQSNHQASGISQYGKIEAYIIKREKVFGRKRMKIWGVYLGNTEL